MKVICDECKEEIEYSNWDIVLGGYPHIECPYCGFWILVEF